MLYLYNVSVPPFTYNTLLANIGSMRNSGTEIAVGLTPLKTQDMELNVNVKCYFSAKQVTLFKWDVRWRKYLGA